MFYQNKHILKTALSLMVCNSDDIQLMSNINKAFSNVNTEKIVDVEIRNLCNTIKKIANDIQEKGLRTPESTRMYIESSSLDEETKKLVLGMNQRFTEQVIQDYNYYFTKMRLIQPLKEAVDSLNDEFDKTEKSGIEKIKPQLDNLLVATRRYEDIINELSQSVTNDDMFMIDTSSSDVKTIGMEKLEQSTATLEKHKLRTGMWVDYLTGGGFINKALYIVSAIAGGFKSGFLQNVVERIATTMKPEDFYVPSGMTPCIYYINLEMTGNQMLERRLAYFGENMDDIMVKLDSEDNKTTLTQEVSKILEKNNSRIPIIFQQGRKYSIHDIKLKLKDAERMGYFIVCLVVDYIGEMDHISTNQEQIDKKIGIVAKAEALRNLANEFDIPVLTAAQLNREAEDLLKSSEHRAGSEDIIQKVSSAQLAQAHALKAIPEQIYMCYKYTVNDKDYFSIIVDKDRQNKSKYVQSENSIDIEDKKHKTFKKKKFNSGRITYVAPLEGFKISDKYSNSIRAFEDVDESMFDMMEVEEG